MLDGLVVAAISLGTGLPASALSPDRGRLAKPTVGRPWLPVSLFLSLASEAARRTNPSRQVRFGAHLLQ